MLLQKGGGGTEREDEEEQAHEAGTSLATARAGEAADKLPGASCCHTSVRSGETPVGSVLRLVFLF